MTLIEHESDPVVEVSYVAPGAQRRWTVAIRLILLIPHMVVGVFYGIGGAVAVVAGWFSALALGRLPSGIRTFLGNVLRYYARVYGYAYLLDDTYPTFDLEATDGAVQVRLPEVQPLNRAAVLFRLVLAFPAGFVMNMVSQGLFVFMVFGWLICLITGKLPTPLYGAFAAFLRYSIRFWAYFGMLTSEYPRGLYGDKSHVLAAPVQTAPPPPGATVPSTRSGAVSMPAPPTGPMIYRPDGGAADVAAPLPSTASIAHRPGGSLASIPPPPPPPVRAAVPLREQREPLAAPTLTEAPRVTRLLLTRGAKAVLVVSLIIGVVSQVVLSVQAAQTSATLRELDRGYQELVAESFSYFEALQRCSFRDDAPECGRVAAEQFSPAFERFEVDLEAIDFPAGTAGLARDLRDRVRDASDAVDDLAAPARAATEAQFAVFEQRLLAMDEAYFALRFALGATG